MNLNHRLLKYKISGRASKCFWSVGPTWNLNFAYGSNSEKRNELTVTIGQQPQSQQRSGIFSGNGSEEEEKKNLQFISK